MSTKRRPSPKSTAKTNFGRVGGPYQVTGCERCGTQVGRLAAYRWLERRDDEAGNIRYNRRGEEVPKKRWHIVYLCDECYEQDPEKGLGIKLTPEEVEYMNALVTCMYCGKPKPRRGSCSCEVAWAYKQKRQKEAEEQYRAREEEDK